VKKIPCEFMLENNTKILKQKGFLQVKGFSKYAIKDGVVVNIHRLQAMKTQRKVAVNLTMNNGVRTTRLIADLVGEAWRN